MVYDNTWNNVTKTLRLFHPIQQNRLSIGTLPFQPVLHNNLSPHVKLKDHQNYDNVSSGVCSQEFPSKDPLKIHNQSDMQYLSCYICKCIEGSEEYKQYLERETKQSIEDVKQNEHKGFLTSPSEQSQPTCKTQGLPEVVTGCDNVSSDVCNQEFSSKDALEIHMQSHMP